ARAERVDRAIDDRDRKLVSALERARPDTAGEARVFVLAHELEELGLAPLVDEAARVRFHRRASRVGLHAAPPPARAARAADLDHHVPDLACAAAASRSASSISRATSAGPPRVGVAWRADPSTLCCSSKIAASIFVPPRSIPPRARERSPGILR